MGKQRVAFAIQRKMLKVLKMGKRSHWSKSEAHYQFLSFIIKWVSLLMLRFTPFSLPFIEVDKNKGTSWKRKLC